MSKLVQSEESVVCIGNDALQELNNFLEKNHSRSRKFILCDSNTVQFCLPPVLEQVARLSNAIVIQMPGGESAKTIQSCELIWKELLSNGADRDSILIAVGGGVVGDVGGLAASLYMRGISMIQVPTSLLSMADASVGGKTGVNFSGIKNLVGTFSKPQAIFTWPGFLKTLPVRHLKSGFAEVIKHHFLSMPDSLVKLGKYTDLSSDDYEELIRHSVSFKRQVVGADFRDLTSRRILNFGHTIGHAVEARSLERDEHPLLHGEAIAIGMICELILSRRYAGLPADKAMEACAYLYSYYSELNVYFQFSELQPFLDSDKKNKNSQVSFVLLKDFGMPVTDYFLSAAQIKNAWEECQVMFRTAITFMNDGISNQE